MARTDRQTSQEVPAPATKIEHRELGVDCRSATVKLGKGLGKNHHRLVVEIAEQVVLQLFGSGALEYYRAFPIDLKNFDGQKTPS